jgi:uncharacterized protein (TIGR04255 family)
MKPRWTPFCPIKALVLGYTPATMSIDALFPVAGDHAIQNVAFVIEWPAESPLSSANLQAVKALHGALKDVFPVVQEHQTVTFNIDTANPNQPPVSSIDGIGAVHLMRPNPALGSAAIARSIQVSKSNAVIVIGDYTRWDAVWSEVSCWIEKLLPIILDGRPITAVNLQYNDRLTWRGDPATFDPTKILRNQSRFVPPNVFEVRDLWHSHHGYIETRQNPVPHRLIDNINVSLVMDNLQLALQVFTSHQGTLDTPVWNFDVANDCVSKLMNDLHDRNKSVLRELFTEEVCARINLKN